MTQSAYAVQSLDKNREYEPIITTMSLIKQVTKTALLIPYEPFYIQSDSNHKNNSYQYKMQAKTTQCTK
jgi:hypothetical protein